MESQNSQINGTKTRPPGKESLRVPGSVLARHCGEASHGEGSIVAQPPTLPGNCVNGLPWARFFLYLEDPTTFRGCLGRVEIWDSTFYVLPLESYASVM